MPRRPAADRDRAGEHGRRDDRQPRGSRPGGFDGERQEDERGRERAAANRDRAANAVTIDPERSGRSVDRRGGRGATPWRELSDGSSSHARASSPRLNGDAAPGNGPAADPPNAWWGPAA